jgi:hypothetical protein
MARLAQPTTIILALAVCMLTGTAGAASLISVNPNANDSGNDLLSGETAGAPGWSAANWNNIGSEGTATGLVDAAGNPTAVSLTFGWFYPSNTTADGSTPDGRMMRGFNRQHDNEGTWVFGGLNAALEHNIVVYWDANAGQDTQGHQDFTAYDAGGEVLTVRLHEPNGGTVDVPDYDFEGYVEATTANGYTGNYFVFSGLTPTAGGELTIGVSNPEGFGRKGLSGLQLHVIPEPASVALLALGAPALLRRRR